MSTKAKPITFLKEVRLELEKVTWPNREEAIRLTGVVIIIAVLVGIFIGLCDYLFTKLTQILLIS